MTTIGDLRRASTHVHMYTDKAKAKLFSDAAETIEALCEQIDGCVKVAADALRQHSACVAIVERQANDEALWFVIRTASEAYLQHALRELHSAVENKSPEDCAVATLTSDLT
jgi:hypothetical protein